MKRHYLIQYYHLDMINFCYSFLDKIQDSPRGSYHDMHYTRLENIFLLILVGAKRI